MRLYTGKSGRVANEWRAFFMPWPVVEKIFWENLLKSLHVQGMAVYLYRKTIQTNNSTTTT